jgi:uncharacterized membrane protein YoaK (UPF0700 family)
MLTTLHTPETIYSPRHVPSWLLLAASAGIVNGVGFLVCEQYVTHVTGTATRIGLESHQFGIASEFAVVVVSFLVGAMASVFVILSRLTPDRRPRWATPLLIVTALLAGIGLAGHQGLFGPFGATPEDDPPSHILLALLSLAMGMQSAAVASTTGLAVRTTHLTGPMTDLGIHLASAMIAQGEPRRAALRGAMLRGGKVAAFVCGAALSMPLADHFGYLTFLVPAAFILTSIMLSFVPEWGPSDFPNHATVGIGGPPPTPTVAAADS